MCDLFTQNLIFSMLGKKRFTQVVNLHLSVDKIDFQALDDHCYVSGGYFEYDYLEDTNELTLILNTNNVWDEYALRNWVWSRFQIDLDDKVNYTCYGVNIKKESVRNFLNRVFYSPVIYKVGQDLLGFTPAYG
jgi:hypothetical protein